MTALEGLNVALTGRRSGIVPLADTDEPDRPSVEAVMLLEELLWLRTCAKDMMAELGLLLAADFGMSMISVLLSSTNPSS
jgi:hypothetical protein